jgi:hypothetical protein
LVIIRREEKIAYCVSIPVLTTADYLAHKTRLTLSLFTEVHFPRQASERSCTYVFEVSILSIHEDIKILKSNSNIIVLLKLYFYVADVAEWSWPLDMKLRNWCCSVSIVFEFESRRGGTKKCQFKNLILTRLVFIMFIFSYVTMISIDMLLSFETISYNIIRYMPGELNN